MPKNIRTILAERKSQHGKFTEQAGVAQALKRAMKASPNWNTLSDSMKEALEMDAHKTARILAGDPNLLDHWQDKVGYITLIVDALE